MRNLAKRRGFAGVPDRTHTGANEHPSSPARRPGARRKRLVLVAIVAAALGLFLYTGMHSPLSAAFLREGVLSTGIPTPPPPSIPVLPSQTGSIQQETTSSTVISTAPVAAETIPLSMHPSTTLPTETDESPNTATGEGPGRGKGEEGGEPGAREEGGKGKLSSKATIARDDATGEATPVSWIMPVHSDPQQGPMNVAELLSSLLLPLVEREEALCYRRGHGMGSATLTADTAVPTSVDAHWTLHIVVITDASPSDAFAELMSSVKATKRTPAHDQRTEDIWTMQVQDVRSIVGQRRGAKGPTRDTSTRSCYADTMTVVAIVRTSQTQLDDQRRPLIFAESYVEAGLRTEGGAAGKYFLVLPSYIVPSRAPHTTFANETRQPPYGFTEALLHTARRRNNGRVAAVQCGILTHDPVGIPKPTAVGIGVTSDSERLVPVPLTMEELPSYKVVDRGGFVTAASDGHLLPFVSRRYAGLRACDQRVLFEEPIGGVSFHCGLFHKALYDEIGGLSTALKGFPTLARPDGLQDGSDARTIHYAADSAGWKLSFAMQEHRPSWQVYASRAVGVWLRPAQNGELSPLEWNLGVGLYALTDAYGQRHAELLQLLQARRFGLNWRDRLAPLIEGKDPITVANHQVDSVLAAATVGLDRPGMPPGAMLPPVLTYFMDFPCACCGLAREAAGYLRPMIERYGLSVDGDRDFCQKDGSQLLGMAFPRHRLAVFEGITPDEIEFWRAKASARVQVNFLHVRAQRYHRFMRFARKGDYSMSIGRSLSEFSNIQPEWVENLKTSTDRLWVTADFFKTVYRRHGVDEAKIRTVPEAVDTYEYDPANVQPLPMPFKVGGIADNMPHLTSEERSKRYVFLSIFKWEQRKGWDVLLSAYYDAFGPNAPPEMQNRTTLILKVNFKTRYSRGLHASNLGEYLRNWAQRTGAIPNFTGLETLPHTIVVGGGFSNEDLIRLYATADAFVFPSRGEGWGLPASEAMSMGLPLIMTPWSGLLGFITPDTCFRIPLDGLEELPQDSRSAYGFHEGKKWALPSRNGTATLMRYVVANPEHAREVGRRGRRLMLERFSEEAVADSMDADIAAYLREEVKRRQAKLGFGFGW